MLAIKDLILTTISVPPEQRELTLEEFKITVGIRNNVDKSER